MAMATQPQTQLNAAPLVSPAPGRLPLEWYRSSDGKRASENILSWRSESGGYAWHGNWGDSVLTKYANWRRRFAN